MQLHVCHCCITIERFVRRCGLRKRAPARAEGEKREASRRWCGKNLHACVCVCVEQRNNFFGVPNATNPLTQWCYGSLNPQRLFGERPRPRTSRAPRNDVRDRKIAWEGGEKLPVAKWVEGFRNLIVQQHQICFFLQTLLNRRFDIEFCKFIQTSFVKSVENVVFNFFLSCIPLFAPDRNAAVSPPLPKVSGGH